MQTAKPEDRVFLAVSKLNRTTSSDDELRKRVLDMLVRGECEIAEERNGRVYRLKATKGGNSKQVHATLKEIEKTITKHGLELKERQGDQRVYRRKEELPDPTQSHRSEVNRLKKQFRVRVEPDLQQRVDDAAKAEGMTRQDWVERALKRALGEPE